MQYQGGKFYLKKQLKEFFKTVRRPGQLYVEPFVGGYNSFEDIEGPKLGNDLCPYIIALGNALMAGWLPPSSLSKEEYYEIKANMDSYPKELVAFAAYGCSFGAKWWGGYGVQTRGEITIPLSTYAYNTCIRLSKKLKNTSLACGNYYDLEIPDGSLVYCDPPYKGTTGYHTSKGFDYDRFYDWLVAISKENYVYISERLMPEPFIVCKEFTSAAILRTKNGREKVKEYLYTLR